MRVLGRGGAGVARTVGVLGAGVLVAAGLVVGVAAAPAEAVTAPAGALVSAEGGIAPSSTFIVPQWAGYDSGPPQQTWIEWTQGDWEASLTALKAVGLSDVVLQMTALNRGPDEDGNILFEPYFENRDQSGKVIYPEAGEGVDLPETRAQLGRALAAAKKVGVTVTIGVGLSEGEWFSGAPAATKQGWEDPVWLAQEADRAIRSIKAIWAAYGTAYRDTISGWYLPYELEGYELGKWESTTKWVPAPEKADPYVTKYLGPVSNAAVAVSGKTRVMVSPLFDADTDNPTGMTETAALAAWEAVWEKVFTTTKVTVVAPQDGAGSGTSTTDEDLERWIGATVNAKIASQIPAATVWGNAENYRDQNKAVDNMAVRSHTEHLAAMKRAGATKLMTFSAHRLDPVEGHDNADINTPFYAAYKKWVSGALFPAQAMTAPASFTAVGGSGTADPGHPDAAVDEITTARLTWKVAAPTSSDPDRVPVGYLVLRDGRHIAEYPPPVDDGDAMVHVDRQLQPGRTYTYQVVAFDAWGSYSPAAAAVNITVPWTPSALVARDGKEGDFNVARNAPYSVTKTADGVRFDTAGLAQPAVGTSLDTAAAYKDPVEVPGVIGQGADQATYVQGAATDTMLASANVFDGRWQGQIIDSTSGYWAVQIDTSGNGDGVSVRQVNTQWARNGAAGVYGPNGVEVVLKTKDGKSVNLGSQTSQSAATNSADGVVWFNHTADTEIEHVTSVVIAVYHQSEQWVFLGEAQAMDDAGNNGAAHKPYLLQNYNSAAGDLAYNTTGTNQIPFAGTRPWALTDGTLALPTSHADPSWTGRQMGANTANGDSAYLTLDLGSTQRGLTNVTVGTYHDAFAGIHTPNAYQVRTATADQQWSAWTPFIGNTAPSSKGRKPIVVNLNGVDARYVQVRLRTNNAWLFLDEVEVHTTIATNTALNKPVTNLTRQAGGCPGTECSRAAAAGANLNILTSGTPFTSDLWAPTDRWATSNTLDLAADVPEFATPGITYQVDLGATPQRVTEITTTWAENYDAGVILPADVTISYRTPGGTWRDLPAAEHPSVPQEFPRLPLTWTYRTVTDITTTAIRVHATNSAKKPWLTGNAPALIGIADITTYTPTP